MSDNSGECSVAYVKRPIWHSPPWITAIVGLIGTFLTVPQYLGDYLEQQQAINGERQVQELELVKQTLLQQGTERIFLLRYISATADDDDARNWAKDEVARFVEVGTSLKDQLGIPPPPSKYTLNLQFGSSSATLSAQNKMDLDSLIVEEWKGAKDLQVIIIGHTSNTPLVDRTTKFNSLFHLSKARADAVADYLSLKLGLDRKEIVTEGRADIEPIVSNDTREGRAKNDRIDLIISGSRK